MKLDYAARVDIGPKPTNDDRVLISGQILDMLTCSGSVETPAAAVVCDGCGGYAGGYIAATTVLETIAQADPADLTDPEVLADVLRQAREKVAEKKLEMPEYSAMCTTVAGCVFTDTNMVTFHAGDSRVYRHDKWALVQMTRDHSVVQDMVEFGEILPEEARTHPKRNVITRCIGVECLPPDIYLSYGTINPGEKYLFCSDGLWEAVEDEEIKAVLDSDMTLQEMADALVDKALAQGTDDNVSVCICAAEGSVAEEEKKPFVLD